MSYRAPNANRLIPPAVVLAMICISCATSPQTMMSTLNQSNELPIMYGDDDALCQDTVVELRPGQETLGRLAYGDPIMFFQENLVAIKSGRCDPTVQGGDAAASFSTVPSDSTTASPHVDESQSSWRESIDEPGHVPLSWKPTRLPGKPFRTYVDVFKIDVKDPCAYEITVEAISSLWNSTAITPFVRLLNSDGELLKYAVAQEPREGAPKARVGGSIIIPGDYFIVVGSDNSIPGSQIGSEFYSTGGGMNMSGNGVNYLPQYPVVQTLSAAPEGDYLVTCRLRGP